MGLSMGWGTEFASLLFMLELSSSLLFKFPKSYLFFFKLYSSSSKSFSLSFSLSNSIFDLDLLLFMLLLLFFSSTISPSRRPGISYVFFSELINSLFSLVILIFSSSVFFRMISSSISELFFFSSFLSKLSKLSILLSSSLLKIISPDWDFSLSKPLIFSSFFFVFFFSLLSFFLSLPNRKDSKLSSLYFILGSEIFILFSSNSSSSSSNSAPEFNNEVVTLNKISKKFLAFSLSCSSTIFLGSISKSASSNLPKRESNRLKVSIFSSGVLPGVISPSIFGRRILMISR